MAQELAIGVLGLIAIIAILKPNYHTIHNINHNYNQSVEWDDEVEDEEEGENDE